MSEEVKPVEKSVFKIGEKIPMKGFWFRVIDTDTHTVKLQVCGPHGNA